MRDLRAAFLVIGVLLVGLAAAMLAPMIADLVARSPDWRGFAGSAAACAFVGGGMAISARGPVDSMTPRAAFLMTTLSWLILAAAGAAPFVFSTLRLSPAEAFFESMSGLTTTGATVITGLDTKSPGILFWRAILQWLGGVGIVVTALAVLPALKVGGMQLFKSEWFDPLGKILPRASEIAASIGVVYLVLTLACSLTYAALGIDAFDAVCLAMTTISTGGFANSDGSFSTYAGNGAEVAAVVFMMCGGMPFGLLVLAMRGRVAPLLKDAQARGYFGAILVFVIVFTAYLVLRGHFLGGEAIRRASFNVVSIMTGTGFGYGDFTTWGAFSSAFLFCLMFVGGCAGSTACSIKVFRYQVAFVALRSFVREMARPHNVAPMRYNHRPLPTSAVHSVLSFFFLFFAVFATAALILSIYGLDTTTALSAAATSIANVGPGLGARVGPAGSFATLPDPTKWVLAFTMLAGRLEILTVLVIFTPSFWRQ